jgi:hypothetical protein
VLNFLPLLCERARSEPSPGLIAAARAERRACLHDTDHSFEYPHTRGRTVLGTSLRRDRYPRDRPSHRLASDKTTEVLTSSQLRARSCIRPSKPSKSLILSPHRHRPCLPRVRRQIQIRRPPRPPSLRTRQQQQQPPRIVGPLLPETAVLPPPQPQPPHQQPISGR